MKLLVKELINTTNTIKPNSSCFVYQVVKRLINDGVPAKDITFITCNYDLNIERVLELLSYELNDNNIFSFPNCYRFDRKKIRITHTSLKHKKKFFDKAPNSIKGIAVLKLHGSLNWYSRHTSDNPSRRALFNPVRHFWVTNRWSSKAFWKSKNLYTFPVIIPPVIHKSGVLHEVVKPVWQFAEVSLSKAKQIIILGYSCPNTDIENANLIKRVFRGCSNRKKLHIIDPNPEVLMRYVELTNATTVYYHRTVNSFLSSLNIY